MDGKNKSRIDEAKGKGAVDRTKYALVALLLLISTSTGFIGGWLGASSRSHQDSIRSTNEARQVVLQESQVINEIAQTVGESVVSVNVTSQGRARSFFGFDQSIERSSAGTGFIISKDGVILTNRHVVPSSTRQVSITLSDGTELDDVEVIGRTSEGDPLDIAFLKVRDAKGKDLKPVKLGDSSKTEVGDKVVAIGNALGQFQNTVTAGIISGFGRSVQAFDSSGADTLQNLFQTDAAINEGNSGGPLVNMNGEVIGVNTAVAGGGAENIGFAIPVNDIKGLISSVLEEGELKRPYLGVRYIQLTDDIAFQFELETKRGAFIVPEERGGPPSVIEDSPAAKAGLQEGDIITKVDGDEVNENNSLTSLVGRHKVGDTITVTYVRDNQERTTEIKLEAMPES